LELLDLEADEGLDEAAMIVVGKKERLQCEVVKKRLA